MLDVEVVDDDVLLVLVLVVLDDVEVEEVDVDCDVDEVEEVVEEVEDFLDEASRLNFGGLLESSLEPKPKPEPEPELPDPEPDSKAMISAVPPEGTLTTQNAAPPAPSADSELETLPMPFFGSMTHGKPLQPPPGQATLRPNEGVVLFNPEFR